MSLAVDGLASGLDTTALINSLMQLEARPQTLLKNKVSDAQSMISALRGLNAKIASLATSATKTAGPDALDLHSATSSSATATTAVRPGASAGQMNVVVKTLAQAQVAVSAAVSAWPDDPPVLTVVASDGTHTQVTGASASLDDVAAAINGAEAGVTAVKVSTGGGNFRLQFTSTETGADAAFEIHRGTSAQVTDGTSVDVLTAPGAATISAAQDAEVVLWAGTAAEEIITSATNTFADILPSVDLTVSAVSADPITLKVERDDSAISKVAEGFVSDLNSVFALIDTKTAVNTNTGADGSANASGGMFTGDSTVRDAKQRLLTAASMPVDGRSPSEIGVSVTKTGVLEFDAEKFAKALAEEPDHVEAVMQELASRVAAAATVVSDRFDGTITSKITGQESLVKNFSTQIEEWNGRLEARRTTLERTYAAMEVQLSALNSQASWLSAQLPSLSSGNRNGD